jgi:hypothetical protein
VVAADYPEQEFVADGAPYRLQAGAVTVTIASDSPDAPSKNNQWLRVDQGSQVKSNFPAGARLLMFPNAGQVTLTFTPGVHGVSVALGNSDFGQETFLCTANGVSVSVIGTSAVMGSAPIVNFAPPVGQVMTTLTIHKQGDRPQLGLLLGPITITP